MMGPKTIFNILLYRNLRRFYTANRWRERRFTRSGLLLFFGIIAAAVVGVDTHRTTAYQVFTLLVSILIIAILFAPFFRGKFAVRRMLPRFATAGEPIRYRIFVENRTRKRQQGLLLAEDFEDPRPDFETFMNGREPEEETRNIFDRAVKFYRWQWLIEKRLPRMARNIPLPEIGPGDEAEIRADLLPHTRGVIRFAGATLLRPDPLGLFCSLIRLRATQKVMVLPRRYPLPRLSLPGGRRYQSGGVALTSSVGESDEFVSLRDYRPGDPLRHIHWKSWAKLGKPVVKEFEDEFFVRHSLVLDTFGQREGSLLFEEAVSVAASFAYSIRTEDSLLDLIFVGADVYHFTSGRGLFQQDRILEVLAGVNPCPDKPFELLSARVLERASTFSGCICVLQAWDEPRRGFVGRLKSVGLPVLVLVVTEADDPDLDAGPMKTDPANFRQLRMGRIQEELNRL